jgi:aminoglycoside phosphotransferase (APT) family kinase protein
MLLASGARVWLLRRLPGRSHTVYLARWTDTDRLIVVKAGGNPDSLRREADMLNWLGASAAPVPSPAEVVTDCRGRPVLMLQHVIGHHPLSTADFAVAGHALATLHAVSLSPRVPPLPGPAPASIDEVMRSGEILAQPARMDLAPLKLRLTAMTPSDLSCVHGDASAGNVLITPSGLGVLLDLENAHVSHPGLDVGRFLFLASQAPAITDDMLRSFLAGYGRPPVPAGDLTDWIAIAGLEIAIWRARNPRWGLSAADAIARVADWLGTGPAGTPGRPALRLAWPDGPSRHRVSHPE